MPASSWPPPPCSSPWPPSWSAASPSARSPAPPDAPRAVADAAAPAPGRLRSVRGCPVLWKECRTPWRLWQKIGFLLVILFALATYFLVASEENLNDNEIQISYVLIYFSLGVLYTLVLPATCVTAEKESHAWPLLLTTTLKDHQIIRGKFLGILRRCLPVWFFLFAHLFYFCAIGVLAWAVLFQMTILVAWLTLFFCASGVYFSTRFKRTNTAVIMNFLLGLILWALIPFLLVIAEIRSSGRDIVDYYCDFIPFAQAVVIIDGPRPFESLPSYNWPSRHLSVEDSYLIFGFSLLLYLGLAAFFLWRACARLRRNPI